jgi:hypothetical protein
MRLLAALAALLVLAVVPAAAVAKKRHGSNRAVVLQGELAPLDRDLADADAARDDDDEVDRDRGRRRGAERPDEVESHDDHGDDQRDRREGQAPQDGTPAPSAPDETDEEDKDVDDDLEDELEPVSGEARLVDTKRGDVLQVKVEHLAANATYAVALHRGTGCEEPEADSLPGFTYRPLVADEDGDGYATAHSRAYAYRADATDYVTVTDAEGTIVACGELTRKRSRG